jgi:branched-chain amino acid transport system substrate-binding protein
LVPPCPGTENIKLCAGTENRKVYMNKNSKRVLAVVAASVLALGTVATTQANAAVKEVTLAFQGPLTGADAQLGQDQLPGAVYAIALYNATKPKVKINLIKADSQCDPTVATNVAPGIAANKKVIGLIGTSCSGEAKNSLPYYKPAGLTMISPSATNVDLSNPKSKGNGFPVFHRVVPFDATQSVVMAKVAAKGVTSPKFYIVDDQTTYGKPLCDDVKPAAKKLGTIVGSDSVPKLTNDYSVVASKAIAAGANSVIYCGYQTDGAKFIKALRDGGSKAIFTAGDGVNTSDFTTLAGSAAEGVRLTAPDVPFDLLVSKTQLADFQKVTGVKVPGLYVTSTFDATNIYIDCIKKGKVTRPGIAACVASGTWTGIGGSKIKFDRYGDLVGGAPVGEFVVEGGVIKYLGGIAG